VDSLVDAAQRVMRETARRCLHGDACMARAVLQRMRSGRGAAHNGDDCAWGFVGGLRQLVAQAKVSASQPHAA